MKAAKKPETSRRTDAVAKAKPPVATRLRVFFSWQSDLNPRDTAHAIRSGLRDNNEMTNQELVEKLLYLRDGAIIYRDLAHKATGDHRRRILARGVLVVLDSFLKLAPQLKNRMPNLSPKEKTNRADVEAQINKLQHDFDSRSGGCFDKVRDGFGGHRLPLSLGDAISLWVDIDDSVGAVFVEEMDRICDAMSVVGATPASKALMEQIESAIPFLQDANVGDSLVVSADDLGMTRGQTVGLVPNPTQIRFSRIVSLIDFIKIEASWAASLNGLEQVRERVLALWLLDAFNALENLYEEKDSNGLTIFDDFTANGHSAAAVEIKKGIDKRDSVLEGELRQVRNHWAAHLDQAMTLDQIQAEAAGSRLTEFSAYVNQHMQGFQAACSVDPILSVFCIHGQKLKGFDKVAHKPRGFDL